MRTSLAIAHLALIIFCVYSAGRKWNVVRKPMFWCAFFVRLFAGICLGLIYTYYYSASDTWQFFSDAKMLSAIGREDFLSYIKILIDFGGDEILPLLTTQEFRSVFFIKIISLLCLLSLDNYWVCAAYLSLLAFIVSWSLHRKVISLFPEASSASSLAFLFFPSVVFWSSGLEKESLAMCGIFFLTRVFLTLMVPARPGKTSWLLAILAALVVWSLKYYWAIVFFMAVLTAFVMRFMTSWFPSIKRYQIGLWVVLFFGIGVLLSFSHPNLYLNRFLEVIVSNNYEFVAHSSPQNLIHYIHFDQTWTSIIVNSPWALASGLFRPVLGEGHGVLGLLASMENLLLLTLFFGAFVNIKSTLASSHQITLLAVISYCVVLCVFLALSTPNFGTLSRYRIGFLPFLVFILAYRNPVLEWVSAKLGEMLHWLQLLSLPKF
ncbi:MAG TPA: hypothetical protein VKQ08_01085 [Cyclobacteriaceae bacterium]|nr:hypothetical protein [Cyclobacteriaceae bacterium]